MSGYKVSIIIPTYNRKEALHRTLESIEAQSLERDEIQVIVADDGSSDGTEQLLEGWAQRLHLRYVRQEDEGFRAGQARNLGIRAAEAPLCLFVDCGILLGSRAVQAHLDAHEAAGKEVAVIGYIYGFEDESFEESVLQDLAASGVDEALARIRSGGFTDVREPLYRELGDDLSAWPAAWVIFWSGNVSVRTQTLFRVGLFDEFYRTWGGEDTDLGLALERDGVDFALSREAESLHYPHKEDESRQADPEERERDFERKRDYMHAKYDTEATALWHTCYYTELNQKLLERRGQRLVGQEGGGAR
ncbi:glycosyltransferase [Paenibacillus albicereus]|uniref:Glycosyltransferase n=1 Tax=Paenibacillus albicereus TaxID=2726185 RepID=A0A6H2H1N1_9BACL|nr:glycosyltransferase [Paenibacillus albicereus]QJC53593.1 glycosyltransferase [Paenibacillus albicereus]